MQPNCNNFSASEADKNELLWPVHVKADKVLLEGFSQALGLGGGSDRPRVQLVGVCYLPQPLPSLRLAEEPRLPSGACIRAAAEEPGRVEAGWQMKVVPRA